MAVVTDSNEQRSRAQAVGARIAQARKEAGGMSQGELAMLLGVSERSVQLYEAGDVIPYKYMQRLEEILSRPMAWFLHGETAIRAQDDKLTEILEQLAELSRKLDRLLAQ